APTAGPGAHPPGDGVTRARLLAPCARDVGGRPQRRPHHIHWNFWQYLLSADVRLDLKEVTSAAGVASSRSMTALLEVDGPDPRLGDRLGGRKTGIGTRDHALAIESSGRMFTDWRI